MDSRPPGDSGDNQPPGPGETHISGLGWIIAGTGPLAEVEEVVPAPRPAAAPSDSFLDLAPETADAEDLNLNMALTPEALHVNLNASAPPSVALHGSGEFCSFCDDALPDRVVYPSQWINHIKHCSDMALGQLIAANPTHSSEQLIAMLKADLIAQGKKPVPCAKFTWCIKCVEVFQDPVRTQHMTKCRGMARKLFTKKAISANTQPKARPRNVPTASRPSALIEVRAQNVVEIVEPQQLLSRPQMRDLWDGLPDLVDAALYKTHSYDFASHRVTQKLAGAVRSALTFTLQSITSNLEDIRPCISYFMFTKCILQIPIGKLHHDHFDELVVVRCTRWKNGDYRALWEEMKAVDQTRAASQLAAHDMDVVQQAESDERAQIARAVKLVKLKRDGDAARTLNDPSRRVQLTPAVKEKLRQKFPVRIIEQFPDGDTNSNQVNSAQLQTLINSFARGLSPGLSQLTADVLQKCLKAQEGAENDRDSFLAALELFINTMLNGLIHKEAGPLMAGAILTPVGEAARPIGSQDILYRLAQKLNAKLAPAKLQPIFDGRQSVLEPHAIKRTAAQVVDMLACNPDARDIAVLSLDIRNGFTAPPRAALAKAVFELYPEAYKIYQWAYQLPTIMRMADGDILVATSGTGQGDPISPAAFSMLLNQVLARVHNLAEQEAWDLLERIYMDDSNFVGRIPYLMTIYSMFDSPQTKDLGLELSVPKSTLYIPNAGIESDTSLRQSYEIPVEMAIKRTGVVIGGVPIGTNDFIQDHLKQMAIELQSWNANLRRIGNQQMALSLYRSTSGPVRVQHLFAALPPTATEELAMAVDRQSIDMVRWSLDSHLRQTPALSDQSIARIFLPQNKGGIGIAQAHIVAQSAYTAAELAIRAAPGLLQRKELTSNIETLKQTIEHFNRFVDAQDAWTGDRYIQEARSGNAVKQSALSDQVHKKSYDTIVLDNSIPVLSRERLREQSRAGAMGWLRPRFWNGKLIIQPSAFPLLLQRAMGIPMAPANGGCLLCPAREDMFLTHIAECCPHNAFITTRHNEVAKRIGCLWKMAGRYVIFEKGGIIPGQRPADVWVAQVGEPARDLAIDVSIVATVTANSSVRRYRMGFDPSAQSGAMLQEKQEKKLIKYASTFGAAGNSDEVTRFLPAIWSTSGGRAELAKLMVTLLATDLAKVWTYSFAECVDLIYGQVTSVMVNHIGKALVKALQKQIGIR